MDAVRETYYETVATRSVQKNSARHKANGSAVTKLGNKPVTAKEIYDKHGPIITFPSTDNFMSYSDFVRLSPDLKVEFINKMMDRYDISLKYISRHLFNKGDDGLRAMMEKWKLLKQVNMKKKREDKDESIRRFKEEIFDWQERTKKAKEQERIQNQMRKESCPTLITYAEFKKLSPEDQTDFINRVIEYHQVTVTMIAEEVFGIKGPSLYNQFQRTGITKKINNLPTKISRNREIMHENGMKFKRIVSAWKDFSDETNEEPPVEEKVIDIQPVIDNNPQRKVLNMPSDEEFVFDQRTIVNKTDSMIKPLTTGWQQPEVVTEPDPMEYHQMHFSTNYISSNGINMDEIYAIAAFFKNCKRVKVNLEISEV